jgi:hypothetical protein
MNNAFSILFSDVSFQFTTWTQQRMLWESLSLYLMRSFCISLPFSQGSYDMAPLIFQTGRDQMQFDFQ